MVSSWNTVLVSTHYSTTQSPSWEVPILEREGAHPILCDFDICLCVTDVIKDAGVITN